MRVRMIQYVSGGRWDGRNWPDPAFTDGVIDVPDWEGRDLIAGGNALPVTRREVTAAQQASSASAEAAIAAEHADIASREAAAAADAAEAPDGEGAGSEPGEPLAEAGAEPHVAAPADAPAAPDPPAPDPAGIAPAVPDPSAPDPAGIAPVPGAAGIVPGAAAGTAPAPSAPKQAWIDFAVASGADADAAGAMTKADLMSRYGGRL